MDASLARLPAGMIHSAIGALNGIWEWNILSGCFGRRGVVPSDLDGFIERHGHFLFIECKGVGAEMSVGQEIALRRLASHERNTVVLVEGKNLFLRPPARITGFTMIRSNRHNDKRIDGDLTTFRRFCESWWEYVEERG